MPDIVLKDRNGNDITYPGINSIKVRTTNGDKRTFVHGEMVEKTVDPDFSNGDIEITAAENTFISKVTIEKPEDLLPENIREGKEIGGVVGSAFVVDVVETVILEEKTYDDFSEVQGTGIYAPSFAYEFNFVVGETYHVVWDDEEYVRVAYEVDGLTGIGNAAIAGMGEDTGEPFLMGDNGWVPIATLETDASHVIGVSQKAREDAETAVVELSLADGDQEVIPSASDKVLTKAIIKKPETLVPENIAKDVEIAGVVGTHAGGGGGLVLDEEPWLDDVCFWDYDGTMILNIPLAEAATLSELPTPPAHDGLTFLGWNYTLEQINAAEYPIDIGAMYIPSDGKTHLHLSVTNSKYLAVPLNFSQTVSGGVSIDWGDGKAATTVSGTGVVTATHTYSAIGEYDVVITIADGCVMTLGGGTSSTVFVGGSSSYYKPYLTELYIGENVGLSAYAIYAHTKLGMLTIPNTEHITTIPDYGVCQPYLLPNLVIPNSVVEIGQRGCMGYQHPTKAFVPPGALCIPESVKSIASYGCYGWKFSRLCLPKYMTTINTYVINSWAFAKRVFLPDRITAIGDGNFSGLIRLRKIKLPEQVTTIGSGFANGCYMLNELRLMPNVRTIGTNFGYQSFSLTELFIPASVQSLATSNLLGYSGVNRVVIEGQTQFQKNLYMYALHEIIHLSDNPGSTSRAVMNQQFDVWVPDNAVDTYRTLYGTGNDHYCRVLKLSEYRGILPTYN